jgi:hypothetical protein
MHPRKALAPALAIVCAAGLLAGCAQGQLTEDDVADARSGYNVELMNFVVMDDPMAPVEAEPAAADAAGAGAVDGGEPAAEAATAAPPPAPATRDVVLDLLVRRTGGGGDKLSGITVDVEQVDAQEQAKATYRVWIDTSKLGGKGATTQVTQKLEDVEVAPDDKFAVEVRDDVPPDLYGEYREFAEATAP